MRNKIVIILLTFLLTLILVPTAVFADDAVIGTAETEAEESTEGAGTGEADPDAAAIEFYIIGENGETIPYEQGTVTGGEAETETGEEISGNNETEAGAELPNLPISYQAENGNLAYVEDGAELYTAVERSQLLAQIKELLEYGNIGIVTSNTYNSDAAAFAKQKYLEIFGKTKGTLFLIDMYNRRIQFFSGASMYRTLTTAKTNEITDNVYTYASSRDYYLCTQKAFEQVKTVLEGGHIVAPMRFATNAAFAIGLVLLINFIIITVQRNKTGSAKVLTNALVYNKSGGSVVHGVRAVMTNQKKRRHVESSGGGGGFHGGGGGFSGGGGGGGFSGGGGGHSF